MTQKLKYNLASIGAAAHYSQKPHQPEDFVSWAVGIITTQAKATEKLSGVFVHVF